MHPKSVNILGSTYKILYCQSPSEVDHQRRESLFGQIDYWSSTIRIYAGPEITEEKLWQTLIHEVLHAIGQSLNLQLNNEDHHEELDVLAITLYDTFSRNGWLKEPAKKIKSNE